LLLQATGEREIEEAVASLIQQGAAALIVSGDAMFYGRRAQIAELALRYKIPTSCPYREQTRRRLSNELRSQCIGDFPSGWQLRRACPKGEKPADLLVPQPTKFELVINLKTAKALGLDVRRTWLDGRSLIDGHAD
jgi:hypothetical protein